MRTPVIDNATEEHSDNEVENDYVYIPAAFHLSRCSYVTVPYRAGFVMDRLKKKKSMYIIRPVGNGAVALPDASDSPTHSVISLETKIRL